MAVHLDHGIDNQLGSAGGVVVGQPDQALILVLEQVLPVLGLFQTLFRASSSRLTMKPRMPFVNAVPVAVGVPILLAQQMGGVLGLIGPSRPSAATTL